jgi:hypothetical protein
VILGTFLSRAASDSQQASPKWCRGYLQPCSEFRLLTASLRPLGTESFDHSREFAIGRVSYPRVGTHSSAC